MATQKTPAHASEHWAWRSPELGPGREIELPQGRLRFYERGAGPTLLFVHGWLSNANLWRKLVPLLASRFRCITLDLPLGGHYAALNEGCDLTPDGVAALLNLSLDRLQLAQVTLVGNDSGGAYSQIATAARPERIQRLVLNACETPYDAWPPPAFDALQRAAATPAGLREFLSPLRDPLLRRDPLALGRLIKHWPQDQVTDTYVLPALESDAVLRDTSRAVASASQAYVARAGAKLIADYRGSVVFLWPSEDGFFSIANVRRYAAELAHAQVHLIDDAYAFTPEDQPARLAELIAG